MKGQDKMRNIRKTVLNKIIRGDVLMTYKTKSGIGRKSVTVGPYRIAVGGNKWAVSIGGDITIHDLAMSAADHFIEYVGCNDAWNAAHDRGRPRNP